MTKGFFDPLDDEEKFRDRFYNVVEYDTLEIKSIKENAFVSGLIIGLMSMLGLGVFILWITG